MTLTLGELAHHIGAELNGDAGIEITGIQTLLNAQAGQVSFLANATYRNQLADTKASAVIVFQDAAADAPTATLVMANPYLGFALATQLFDNRIKPSGKIHTSASIADTAKIGANVTIGEIGRAEEHTSELQSRPHLVCRLLLEKKKKN